MKKYIFLLTLTTVSLLMTSCKSENKEISKDTTPAISVKVTKVSLSSSRQFLAVSGKIQAASSADVSTRMMGYVTKVHVNVGDKVQKGQLLVSIDNDVLQAKKAQVTAEITKAKTAFNNADKNYNRFKNLFESASITQKEMDDMTANYKIAKAGLEGATQMKNEVNAQFAYANIKAPFSGVITSKNIENGDMANPGMPLISIEVPNDFEVVAMVPETEISQIKKGKSVAVLVKSIDKTLKGTVSAVSTSAKNTGGQYLVKIVLEKTDVSILSGMFSTVQFPVETKGAAALVLIPEDAIITKGQLSGIYTVSQSNTAILRWLRLGRTYGNKVEVLSGLNADESYIFSAEGKLYNGVKIVPSSMLPEGKEASTELN
ncbi:efflux RND transporter periplasmic adaptor subunit [Polaribacter sp.]|jgi:RND family efflux transporter MFP subunit|uniref:efflux RND transporter periplasmic adaptor subunit n=1 Tax=Polaribacter sp. TaxID=1920175 RepID=UPI003F4B890A